MIRYAKKEDLDLLSQHDRHISKEELNNSIESRKVLVMYSPNQEFFGWLRYSLFWDNTPFMNMLFFKEEYRQKGYGTKLVQFWEKEMKNSGYSLVLTSTQSNEPGQFFYRKLGYKDCGALFLPDEPCEIILCKEL